MVSTAKEVETLRAALDAKPATRPTVKFEEFPIVGVIRKPTDEEMKGPWNPFQIYARPVLPYQTALDLHCRIVEPEEQKA